MEQRLKNSDRFKHFIWKRHPHAKSWNNSLPEVIATDGKLVRRLVSQPQYIYFQVFDDQSTAQVVAERVEASVSQGIALLGYSMFADDAAVAILHTAGANEPGWVAFPHKRFDASQIPTMPIRVAEIPKLRLVGGADVGWASGKRVIHAALEQRGETFAKSDHAFNIIDHIKSWTLRTRVGTGEDAKEIRLIKSKAEVNYERSSDKRYEAKFEIDEVIYREFGDSQDLNVSFVVEFDTELLCLPPDWLSFWLGVDLIDKSK